MDYGTLAALGGLILPVYVALWNMNRNIGEIAARTEHNEQAVEHISTTVDRLDDRATFVDARYHDRKTADSFSDTPA